MAIIDRGTRLTYAQLKAHFDGIALAKQQLASKVGDDFTSWITDGYTDNTVARDIDKAIDGATTGLIGLTSVSALAALAGPLDSMRRKLTAETHALTTKMMVEAGYGDYIKALMVAFCSGYDTTYDNFWDAFAALYTSGQYVPGEVVDIMNAVGIKVDPAYCYPPAHKLLADIEYTGAATATMTTKEEIDPLLYTIHDDENLELYVIARNAVPDEITFTITDVRDEDDTPTDTGATDLAQTTVPAGTAAAGVVVMTQASGKFTTSFRDATFTADANGKDDDHFAIRVKTLRSMAFPT